jgi:hypothetical protein
MIQRCLAIFTNSLGGVSDGKVESQYLVGSLSPAGHSISSHSSACGSFLRSSRCAGRTRKPQIESAVSSLFPHAMTPSSTPEVPRIPPIPSRKQVDVAGRDGAACRGAPSLSVVSRQRGFSRFPDGRTFPNADHVPQAQLRDAFSKIIIVAIGSVG